MVIHMNLPTIYLTLQNESFFKKKLLSYQSDGIVISIKIQLRHILLVYDKRHKQYEISYTLIFIEFTI